MNSERIVKALWGIKVLWSQEQVQKFCADKKKQGMTYGDFIQIGTKIIKDDPDKTFTILKVIDEDLCKSSKKKSQLLEGGIDPQLSILFLKKAMYYEEWQNISSAKLVYNLYFQANKIEYQKSILLKALILFYDGELNEALQLIKNTIQYYQNQEVLPGIYMSIVLIYFAKKQYEKALEQLKKWLKNQKDLPIKARLVMAYCYFNLNKFQMAELCFKRILKINQLCVEALIGLAVINQKNEEFQNYFEYLKAAKDVSSNHPLVLLHLAEHYLMLKDSSKVRKLSRKGLKSIKWMSRIHDCNELYRNDYYEFEERFKNLAGQSYHMEGDYQNALSQYLKLNKNKTFCCGWNRIQEIQCFTALGDYFNAQKMLEVHLESSNYLGQLNKDSRMFYDTNSLVAYILSKGEQTIENRKRCDYYYLEALKFQKQDIFLKCRYAHFLASNQEFSKAKKMYEALLLQNQYQICPQLYNNMGIYLLQTGEYEKSQNYFQKALHELREQDLCECDQKGMEIVVLYNIGICYEKRNMLYSAIQTYENILSISKYFTDAYLRLSFTYYKLGMVGQCKVAINRAQWSRNQQFKINHLDRILLLQGYFDLLNLEYDNCRKKIQLLVQQTKYKQLFTICLSYQGLNNRYLNEEMAKLSVIEERKSQVLRICLEDSQSAFSFLVYWVLVLKIIEINPTAVQTIPPEHKVYEAFQVLQQNIDEKCSFLVAYNMAMYSMKIGRLDSAVSIFKEIKLHQDIDILALISTCQMLGGLTSHAIKTIKLNIMMNPADIKQRYRLNYINFKKCRESLNSNLQSFKEKKEILINERELKSALNFFRHAVGINIELWNPIKRESEKRRIESLKMNEMINQILKLLPEVEKLLKIYDRLRRQIQKEEEGLLLTFQHKFITVNVAYREPERLKQDNSQQSDHLKFKRTKLFDDSSFGQPTKKKILNSTVEEKMVTKLIQVDSQDSKKKNFQQDFVERQNK